MAAVRMAAPGVADALAALADASRAVADAAPLQPTLETVVGAAAAATRADVAVLWLYRGERLVASTVCAASEVLEAELEGLLAPAGEPTLQLLRRRLEGGDHAHALSLEVRTRDEELGALEVLGATPPTPEAERVALLAADVAALALRLCPPGEAGRVNGRLELAAEALDALADTTTGSARLARLAALATGAGGALVWVATHEGPALDGSYGVLEATSELREVAADVVAHERSLQLLDVPDGQVVTLQLGEPPVGALQLRFDGRRSPSGDELERLTRFAVRAAHALRFSTRSRELGAELDRSRALLAVVGEAIARLSLAHTLETAVEHVGVLLDADRVAVYLEPELREPGAEGVVPALRTSAARSLDGPHETVAAALLGLALGPHRGRGLVEVASVAREPLLSPVTAAAAEAGVDAAVALPLVAEGAPIGLLAVYPRRPRTLTANEEALLVALAAQLAVAVQNARLHERATALGETLELTLASEREKARRLQALYDISRSFAQSLSLEMTLDELARSLVTLLGVDAAVIRMPNERGLALEARAVHVNDERVDAAARALLMQPQPLSAPEVSRLVERAQPLLVDAASAAELGGSLALLAPFLAKGSTASVVPIVLSGELLATLTLVSLDPRRPVSGDVVETAVSITGQAALAIDNARLYAQQKRFADTMQSSLRPAVAPDVPGLDVGQVYEPSARVDVGGDVYDYVLLEDGRLAVVLGDVTGHGVEATADMAMAKFVFRSLARVHLDPGEFLAAANDVVSSEIAPGKFITMVELVIDPADGSLACACGGHPPPRVVLPDGTVSAIGTPALALGIEAGQSYESVQVELPPGGLVALYTDGVVEARCGGELFGTARLDALLLEHRDRPAADIAAAALTTCRGWSDTELTDDFAVVVIKRTA